MKKPYLRRPFIKKIDGEFREFTDRNDYKDYLYKRGKYSQ